MTARTAFAAAQAAQQATAWPLPDPMVGMVQPGDQIAFDDRNGSPILHDAIAILHHIGKPALALRAAKDIADAQPLGTPRSSTAYEIGGATGTFRMTIIEPLATGRVWFVTDTQILLTKRTSK